MEWLEKFYKNKSLFVFYPMFVYILTSFCWWTYLHMQNIKQIKALQIENTKTINQLHYAYTLVENQKEVEAAIADSIRRGREALGIVKEGMNMDDKSFITASTLNEAKDRYQSKKRMFGGEGIIFLLVLLLGSYRLHRGIQNTEGIQHF